MADQEHEAWVREVVSRATPGSGPIEAEHADGGPVASTAALPFNPAAAFGFAKQYCGSYCPCGQHLGENGGDCTHFIAHALAAGGVSVKGEGNKACKAGLVTWAPDLMAKLEATVGVRPNVHRVPPHALQAGDFGFLRYEDSWEPWHALMLASPLKQNPSGGDLMALTLQHSQTRCATEWVAARFVAGQWYRITAG